MSARVAAACARSRRQMSSFPPDLRSAEKSPCHSALPSTSSHDKTVSRLLIRQNAWHEPNYPATAERKNEMAGKRILVHNCMLATGKSPHCFSLAQSFALPLSGADKTSPSERSAGQIYIGYFVLSELSFLDQCHSVQFDFAPSAGEAGDRRWTSA